MTNKDEYVAPPKKDGGYVLPPKSKQSQAEVTPVNQVSENPEKKEDISIRDDNTIDFSKANNESNFKIEDEASQITNINIKYFGTPKVSFRFYINTYSIFGAFYLLVQFLSYGITANFIAWLLFLGISTYTYSWYADYKRFVGGIFAWFFIPFGGVKLASASASFMNFHSETVKKSWTGNYKASYRTNIGQYTWWLIIVTIIIEGLKFILELVIAFMTIFTHKSTIHKYNNAVNVTR